MTHLPVAKCVVCNKPLPPGSDPLTCDVCTRVCVLMADNPPLALRNVTVMIRDMQELVVHAAVVGWLIGVVLTGFLVWVTR